MKPVYLGGVAGQFHPPEGAPSGLGVLLVPPFGWDDQSTYRARRAWAQDLAAHAHAALRIDLPGTGDSAGSPHDAGLAETWVATIADVVLWLREGGSERITIVALGLGGQLALRAIDAGATIDDVVLWGTPTRGRNLVRELKAFGRLEVSQTGEPADDVPDGEIRAGGHVLSAETATAISAWDLTTISRGPKRAFVLGRDGNGPEDKLVDALRATGTEVTTDPGRGWAAMTPGPHAASAPTDVIAAVEDWIVAPGAGTSTHAAPDVLELDQGVRETPVQWAGGPGRLYGVLAEPAGPPVGTMLLLNAGAIRHIGPNRMWTETARRAAAHGVAVLRMDVEGIGESDGDGSPYIDGAALHIPALPEQVGGAMDQLVSRGLPDRFLLCGMCSGSYWAFQTAVADPRVVGVVSLNQRLFFFDPHAEPNRELRRALRIFTPQGFRYFLQGDRRLLRLGRLMRWLAMAPVRVLASRRAGGAEPVDPLTSALQLLKLRDQRLDLAFSDEEPLSDELTEGHRWAEIEAAGVRMHTLPYISHTLKPVRAQQEASTVIDAVIAETFPAPDRAAAQ